MAVGTWEREDVSDWTVRAVEQRGSTRTLWLEEPATEARWLHKDTFIPENRVEQGEDWSEVVSTQIANLLGIPCAPTRLCTRKGRRGSLSLNVVPEGYSLWEGMTVLERSSAPGYYRHTESRPGRDPARPKVKRPGHTLTNIREALHGVSAPPGFDGPHELTGYDVFAGYMILDALIANRDRHEENWAVLASQLLSKDEQLAPSYDHASSLGFNLMDPSRQAHVDDPARLQVWAEKGTAERFEHSGKAPTLVQHAANAVELCTPEGAHWWQERLATATLEPVTEALRERAVPGMSVLAARFAHDLLDLNLRRLRDAICQHS